MYRGKVAAGRYTDTVLRAVRTVILIDLGPRKHGLFVRPTIDISSPHGYAGVGQEFGVLG